MLDEDGNPIQQPPGALNTLQQPVNPYGLVGPYAAIADRMQQQYAAQNAARQQYLDSIQKRESDLQSQGMSDYEKAGALFQLSGALLSPTTSGGIGGTLESFGKGATALSGPLSKAAEAQRQRQQQIQQLQDARAKMGIEMAGGMDPQSTLSLMKAQQDAQPKLGETERLLGRPELTADQRREAVLQKLGIGKDSQQEEYRNVVRPDGSTITILKKGDQTLDPMTRQPLDLGKIAEEQRAAADADRQSQALEYGVPLMTVDPYAALPQKDREKARLGRYQADTRVLQKQAEEVPDSALRGELLDYKRFGALNQENQRTGPGWNKVPQIFDAASTQSMREIESRLTISAGKDLKGAASDRDVAMFGQSVPSVGKGLEANANTIKFGIMKTATELERRAFLRDYLAVNKTLEGADRKWDEYRNANPFFIYPPNADITKLDPSTLQENKNRLSYGDYFRQQRGRGATPVTRNEQGQLVVGGQ
jgi:hypothetical protein